MTAGVLYASQGAILLGQPRLDRWSDSDYVVYSLFGAAVLVTLAALSELRVAETQRLGRLGTVGFVVSGIGLACLAAITGARLASSDEVLDAGFILGFLLIGVGYLLFGLAASRAGSLALWRTPATARCHRSDHAPGRARCRALDGVRMAAARRRAAWPALRHIDPVHGYMLSWGRADSTYAIRRAASAHRQRW